MSSRDKPFIDANRAAWNAAAPVHAALRLEGLLRDVARTGYNPLDEVLTGHLERIGVEGRDIVHLCCNNGRELISLRKRGGGRCVGVDLSEAFIEQAVRLNEAAGTDCTFLCADAPEAPVDLDDSFDLALVTIGTLGWMPDLASFFGTLHRLLRRGGRIVMQEMHPILGMLDNETTDDPLVPRYAYFDRGPHRDDSGLDYYGKSSYASPPSWWYQHPLADILTGCLESGFTIEAFEEHDYDISNLFGHLDGIETRPPMNFILVARRG